MIYLCELYQRSDVFVGVLQFAILFFLPGLGSSGLLSCDGLVAAYKL